MNLTYHDLQFALIRTPKVLLKLISEPPFAGKVFVGGGFLRSIVAGEDINDIDVFVGNKDDADDLAIFVACQCKHHKPYIECSKQEIESADKAIHKTDNAMTILCSNPVIQVIHRWTFKNGVQVAESFDFTICAAVFWWQDGKWLSYCVDRFYPDLAAKRLIYRQPIRIEEAGGSTLRVLKYYQKGYRIP